MCFAMREGIVDQRSDVCGDVEMNVNERRTTAFPPTLFRSSALPALLSGKPTSISFCIPFYPLPSFLNPSTWLHFSLFSLLSIRHSHPPVFSKALWLLRSCLYVSTYLYRISYCISGWYMQTVHIICTVYIKCQRGDKYIRTCVCTWYWVMWCSQRIIILVFRERYYMLWSSRNVHYIFFYCKIELCIIQTHFFQLFQENYIGIHLPNPALHSNCCNIWI